jgi:pSer/pThr/pTyr-binding forkhead associated (FHA) protein
LLELPTGRVTVGRNDDNRLVLANVSISGHHALLEVLPNALFVTDLGSTNGTLLNDQPLPEGTPTPVNEGDRLTFGALQFRVMN